MKDTLKLLFIKITPKPNAGNKWYSPFLNFFSVLLYPVLIIVSIIIIVVFAVPLIIWQKLTTSNAETLKEQKDEELRITAGNQWATFFETPNLLIYKKLAGSLPWDSGNYLYLESTPQIPYLEGEFFGDWLLVDFGGIFLQMWNHDQKIDCNLLFIPFDTLEVKILKQHILTKNWSTQKLDNSDIEFTFSAVDADFTYVVQQP